MPGPSAADPGPEAFWDVHGASLYALACALLGDEAASLHAVSLAMVDLYTAPGVDSDLLPEVTLWAAAACVYARCHDGLGETPMERTMTAPPQMVWLAELAHDQRAALALCVFGGHTYPQAATRLDLPSEEAANLLTSGLHDLFLATPRTDTTR